MKKKVKKNRKKSNRGKLIKGILENVPAESFDILYSEIEELLRGNSGIYVLYNSDEIYYIGLAKDLKGRLLTHFDRSRHKGKWNKFSVYIIKNIDYLKDLETLLLRIVKPNGNRISGNVPKEARLTEKLKKTISKLRKSIKSIEKVI